MIKTLRNIFPMYIENMQVLNLSQQTISVRKKHGETFLQWCEDRDITTPEQLTRSAVEGYQRYVHRMRKANGQPYAIKSQVIVLDGMRAFCKYLAREDIVQRDPTDRMLMPKVPRSLPKAVLSEAEIDLVLNVPDTTTVIGIRDRAILEVLWATGIRRAELSALDIYSVDFSQEVVMVRLGKGSKDRVVPIGRQALAWVRTYLDESRPILVTSSDEKALFVCTKGQKISKINLSTMVRRHIINADVDKTGSCHLIRHSVGTMLMRNGLNMRLVQQLLGHEKIETTQIYTNLTIMDLKQAYKDAHPAAK